MLSFCPSQGSWFGGLQPTLLTRIVRGTAFGSRGGIGRRVRLRTVWGNPWRFESSREQSPSFSHAGFTKKGKTTGVPRCQVESTDYFAAALLLAAQRAFINWESLLRPAGVSPPFDLAGAVFVPAALLLAAQRAFINRESLRRPAGVSAPFFPAGAVFVVPFSFDQRALAAAASFARVAGEK
jgi:hypothetical protein